MNINFVPEDYIQNNDSRRTNLICIGLLCIILIAIGGAFVAIKMRQRTLNNHEKSLDAEMVKKKEQIKTVEQIQQKRNAMWATATTTLDLIEPLPKSIILSLLTNYLPKDTSLVKIGMIQKEPQPGAQAAPPADKFQAMQDKEKQAGGQKVSKERMYETKMEIEGIAPSDIEVASYIEKLNGSSLLKNVALVESVQMAGKDTKQAGNDDEKKRRFKLTAMLNKDLSLTDNDVELIAYHGNSQTTLDD